MAAKSSFRSLLALLLSLPIKASPARGAQTPQVRPRQSSSGTAAVPAPLHLGATAGSHCVYVPVHLVSGLQNAHSSAGSLWAWVVAAGGAIHGVRQSHEPRPRGRRSNLVAQAHGAHGAPVAHGAHEDGWQTASEDEEEGFTRQNTEIHQVPPSTFPDYQMNFFPSPQPYFENGTSGHWPQMMPLVMVAMPQHGLEASSEAAAQIPPVPQVPAAPGTAGVTSAPPVPLLERVTTPSSEASWQTAASSNSSRWTSRDCEWTSRQLMKPHFPQRQELLQQVIQDAWSLASSKHGTRVVQAALDAADYAEKQLLANTMVGRVWMALKSPHANHVLQKIVALMPPEKIQFVIDELAGRVADAARHPFGCRVLERLLEHCSREQNEAILREVVSDVAELSKHAYGNYVVQHLLEHGDALQRHQLLQQLCAEAKRLARHKVASYVIESALVHAGPEDRQQLKAALAESIEALQSLSASNYGSFVVKEMKKR